MAENPPLPNIDPTFCTSRRKKQLTIRRANRPLEHDCPKDRENRIETAFQFQSILLRHLFADLGNLLARPDISPKAGSDPAGARHLEDG